MAGELDDMKLIEGLTGEKNVYKRRAEQEPEVDGRWWLKYTGVCECLLVLVLDEQCDPSQARDQGKG